MRCAAVCWSLEVGEPRLGAGQQESDSVLHSNKMTGNVAKCGARAEGCVAQSDQCAGDMLCKLGAMQQRHGLAIAAWLVEPDGMLPEGPCSKQCSCRV